MLLNDYIKTVDSDEKHLPFIQVGGCNTCGEIKVKIKVGESIMHPSTNEHYIQNITLYGETKEGLLKLITRFELGEGNTIPYVTTHIKKDVFKTLIAQSLCNLHGLWESSLGL